VFLTAAIPNTDVKVYVYVDGGGLQGSQLDFRAEEWDYKTPEELIAELVNEVKARVAI